MFRKIALSGSAAFLLTLASSQAQTTIVQNGFDTSGGTWGFASDPTEVNASGDVWAPEASRGTITPQSGDRFWSMQDLSGVNSGLGRSGDLTLTFDSIDTSAYTDITVSLYFNGVNLDVGDDFFYQVDTGSGFGAQQIIFAPPANNSSTVGWVQTNIVLGDVDSVALRLLASPFSGSGERAGFDTVVVTGTIPEPGVTALAFAGLICTFAVIRRRRLK